MGSLKEVSPPLPDEVGEPVGPNVVEFPAGIGKGVEELKDVPPPLPDDVGEPVGPNEVEFAGLGIGYGVPPVPVGPTGMDAKIQGVSSANREQLKKGLHGQRTV